MMFAAVGWWFGYDGSFKFEKIGLKYLETAAPYVDMRGLSATCGTLVIILNFLMFIEMKFPLPIALLGTCMMLFGKQSYTFWSVGSNSFVHINRQWFHHSEQIHLAGSSPYLFCRFCHFQLGEIPFVP